MPDSMDFEPKMPEVNQEHPNTEHNPLDNFLNNLSIQKLASDFNEGYDFIQEALHRVRMKRAEIEETYVEKMLTDPDAGGLLVVENMSHVSIGLSKVVPFGELYRVNAPEDWTGEQVRERWEGFDNGTIRVING